MSQPAGVAALRRIRWHVLIAAIGGLLIAGIGSTILVAERQYRELPVVLAAKQLAIATLLGHEIEQAVAVGIPLDKLRGLDDLYKEARRDNPEIGYIAFTDAAGRVVATQGRSIPPTVELLALERTPPGSAPRLGDAGGFSTVAVPVAAASGGAAIGDIFVGIDPDHIRRLIKDRLFDVVTVLVVTAICAVELVLLLLDYGITGPLRSLESWGAEVLAGELRPPRRAFGFRELHDLLRATARAAAPPGSGDGAKSRVPGGGVVPWQLMVRFIRVGLFLFVLGDTMSSSFLPIFARDLATPFWGLTRDFLLSLPVVVYWLISAIAQLFGPPLMERYSHRALFVAGVGFSAAGMAGAALAGDFPTLLAARGLAGLGLGLAFMTCQAAILTHVPKELRTLGIATFTGTFFLATFCGTALGGIAAQQLGFRGALVLSAAVVLICGAFVIGTLGGSRERPMQKVAAAAAGAPAGNSYLRLARNGSFASLLLFCAVPNRMFNVAFLLYLAPLYLFSLGDTKAEIGRVVSLYGIAMAILAPALAAQVDRRKLQRASVVVGSLICALGALAVLLDREHGILIAVATMGIGQAMSVPSQMSLIPALSGRQIANMGLPRVMSVFRVGERLPAFLGPMVAASLAGAFGFERAIAAFGAWVAASAVILALVLRASRAKQESPAE